MMSKNDGLMHDDDLYLTSDISLAAYLLMRGFELLGSVDTGERRKQFGLTHTDPSVLRDMNVAVGALVDEFENMYLVIPHEPQTKVNFKLYYRMMKECHHALDEPIRREVA